MSNRIFTQASVCAALTLLAAHAACAQTTANITIDGTFVPPTCAVSISGGGVLDWGTMTRATVLGYTTLLTGKVLPEKAAQLSVSCPNATVVGLDWSDNRAATRMPLDHNDPMRFGLTNGQVAGQTLGTYELWATAVTTTVGGAIDKYFLQQSTGGTWLTTAPAAAGINYAYPGYTTALGRTATSATAPVALNNFTFTLNAKVFVSTSIVTASTSSILMDGSATVTLKYF